LIPEKRLAVALLVGAVKDYHAYQHLGYRDHRVMVALRAHGASSEQIRVDRAQIIVDRLRAESDLAYEWFNGAEAFIPFRLIAEALGHDPDVFRDRLLSGACGDNLMADFLKRSGKWQENLTQ
jgi:hypothetical protein